MIDGQKSMDLRRLGEEVRQYRLAKDIASYQGRAKELLDELEKLDLLPCKAKEISILTGGRVNYCSGSYGGDYGRCFLKVSPGTTEAKFYRHSMAGRIRAQGAYFSTPDCKFIANANEFSVLAFEWVDNWSEEKSQRLDQIRIAGLAEYHYANRVFGESHRLSGIPYHRLSVRESSLSILEARSVDNPILEDQRLVVRDWRLIEEVMKGLPITLNVRDSGRSNVVVDRGRVILIDNGATHYAPIGFDLWSYVIGYNDIWSGADEVLSSYLDAVPMHREYLSYKAIKSSCVGAACIMGLDAFLKHGKYINDKKVHNLQKAAFRLFEEYR